MDKNNKIIRIGIFLIGVTLVVCISFISYMKVNTPVFLQHYYEYGIQKGDDNSSYYSIDTAISLQYITDISDTRTISFVVFQEDPQITFYPANNMTEFTMLSNVGYSQDSNYGRYSLRTVNLNTIINDIDDNQDELTFSQAIIHFNNGDVIETDIGKIILYVNKQDANTMYMSSGSSSSDGSSTNSYVVTEDITLEEIKSPLLDKINTLSQLMIDSLQYTEISGTSYQEGSNLNVSFSIKYTVNFTDRFINFDIRPKLYYKDSSGNSNFFRIYNIRSPQYSYDYLTLYRYLQSRKEN